MAKYLDENGLLYLWGKIKAILPTKTSQLTNDSGFITTADIPEGAAASTTTPMMDGTAAVGSELAFARGDHVHPSDTTKVDKVEGKGLSTNDFTNEYKTKLDSFSAASNYALKSDITKVYKHKGSVTNESDLPKSGMEEGWVYNIINSSSYGGAGTNVVWIDGAWDALGEVFSIDSLSNSEIDTICA